MISMGIAQLPAFVATNSIENRAPSYCNCKFPKSIDIPFFKGNIHDFVKCRCGENECHVMEWLWDKDTAHPECCIRGPEVTFHPVYSQGTSVIRGNKRLEPGFVHYWEIKVITSLSGTDVMFGIGTDKVDLLAYQYRFASVLGRDDESWGFSYHGLSQHNKQLKHYGKKFSQGCIVGVYVDLYRGYLEFYLNRKPLGIAYTNIPVSSNVNIYPMACSTAAKSSIKLINSTSFRESLQFQCIRVISKRQNLCEELQKMPGLRYLTKELWFLSNKDQFKYSCEPSKNSLPLEDEAVLPSKSKKSKIEDDEELTDIYQNVHKIAHQNCFSHWIDSDDEIDPVHFHTMFCEH